MSQEKLEPVIALLGRNNKQIDLTKVLNHFQKQETQLFDDSQISFEKFLTSDTDTYQSNKKNFDSKALLLAFRNKRKERQQKRTSFYEPGEHLFWIKRAYTFYQDPNNKKIKLEVAITDLINKFYSKLTNSIQILKKKISDMEQTQLFTINRAKTIQIQANVFQEQANTLYEQAVTMQNQAAEMREQATALQEQATTLQKQTIAVQEEAVKQMQKAAEEALAAAEQAQMAAEDAETAAEQAQIAADDAQEIAQPGRTAVEQFTLFKEEFNKLRNQQKIIQQVHPTLLTFIEQHGSVNPDDPILYPAKWSNSVVTHLRNS